ncbi:MAG: response regulator [Nitrospinota bacterium]|nr:response regulator [Nitrospinota bacterium]
MAAFLGSRFHSHVMAETSQTPPVNAQTVLILDDCEKTCAMLTRLISTEMGHQVLVADSGPHALGLLNRNQVDLVLLDLLMPGIDGYKVLESIKSDKKLSQIPVLVLTGVDEVESATRCLGAGAEDYIVKPYDFALLRAKMALFLEKKRMQDTQRALADELEDANDMLRAKVAEVDREVKDRRMAEEALRHSEARMQALADAAFEGIAIHQNGRIVDANQRFSKMFGVNHRLIHGMALADLVGTRDRAAVEKELRDDQDYWFLEITRHSAQVSAVSAMTLELRGRNIPNRGNMAGVLAVRDITSRKRTERELAAAVQEALKATELKDTFISLLSHNLREPLGSIVSMLNAVGTVNMEAQTRDRLLERCAGAANSLLMMIERLLDLGRLKHGKINPKIASVNCWTMAEEMIDRMREVAKVKGVTISNDIPMGWNLNSDQGLLAEVLHNLVSNAIKYSNPGEQVRVGMALRGGPAIVVKDTGVGIDADLSKALFQADPKCRRRGTTGEKGLGIGLSLSMEIMTAMEGAIEFESKEGEGSEFYMRLPFNSAAILLVGKDQGSIVEMGNLIQGFKTEVSITRDATEAAQLARIIRPRLVVTDLDEKDMAHALTQDIANEPDGDKGPLIVILVDEAFAAPEEKVEGGIVKISRAEAATMLRETMAKLFESKQQL